ncbi:AAA family ATPase [Lactiplantibacillus plantarum]|nr:AAA family ATPase [Lactiplantibacillus plantarum]
MKISKQSAEKSFAVMNVNNSLSQSTFIANYALMCARNGQRVLIIDTDYQRNDFLKAFHFQQDKGLFELLQHESEDYKSYIHSLDTNKNLSILPAGQIMDAGASNETVDVLSTDLFSTLYATLLDKFDLILVNLAANASVEEAAPVLEQVDGTILVIDLNSTKKGTCILLFMVWLHTIII